MKRVLVNSYWYYPENTARAFQVRGIVNALLKDGYKVELIIPHSELYKDLSELETEALTIHQVKPGFILHRSKNRWDINRNILNEQRNNFLNKLLKKAYDYLVWPDRTIEWAINAYRYIKKRKLYNNCEAIITVGLPVSTHIIGHLLKKKFPDINWIADYGDPFSYNPDRVIRKHDSFFETKILDNVDSIVIPTSNAIECYTNLGVNKSKIKVIPQLFEEEIRESNYEIDSDKFNIMYAGSFYKGIRSPVEFIRALKLSHEKNEKIFFHYFGNVTALEEFLKVEDIDVEELPIRINGFKDRSEIIGIMKKMDTLINLNNESTSQIPSKIIDYLYTDKFILNIGSRLNDTFANVDNQKEKIANKLVEISLSDMEFDYSELKKMYSYKYNSKRYVDLVNNK
ncbi:MULTISPECIES: transporter [unclassified Bacillus cereus group]|uniref:transporter n=1 Tax=Bacillus cereus group TaxID=86661 RepID=UPI0022E35F03|nr:MULTISPECIES: transporter [unclassified Bacillus cereus group]WAI28849.1 MAG: transporter [Bacillus paranthracis]MDA1789013.1 transporter [Bacillus cereus group sp. BY5-1LC]MDA1865528.1 transporter [Bacillus cereus group sp. BY128LC]WAI33343.1 MAG: transporter [Bacillus paranthracis]WAI38522.1 MAG: transporter [Bacillus paranthracis]